MKSTIEKALQKQKEALLKNKLTNQNSESTNANFTSETVQPSSDVSIQSNQEPSFDSTLKGESPLEKNHVKDLQTLLHIDLQRLEKMGFVGLETSRNLINEEYREIKRKLLTNAFGPLASTMSNSNIIMISSARPAEGKTFTAVNLALSIAAEQDKTVLLVDADVLKPNVFRTLDIEPKNGLMEYLLGAVDDLSDIIYHTSVPKLRLIPAGQSHHLSTELLASAVMKKTVEEFSNRYPDRVVIIDTPPLIGINETAVLANLAGQAVIVVEEGRSKLNDIQRAVERLNPDMAIGFVVNKSTTFSDKGGYYGYQYYGTTDKD
jgi:protein-tyrosine kinase